MQAINIAVVQTHLHWEDVDANLDHIETKIAGVKECDLIVLPEMFSTGFSMRPEALAVESTEKTKPWLLRMSAQLNSAIMGSFMLKEQDKYYNALAFVTPNQEIQWYYKRHLFSPGEESKHYTAGNERLLIDYKGWRILPLICYDLRFPVFSRNTDGIDLMVYVANWPQIRNYAWQQLLKARAIENQTYVVACNRIGQDGNGVDHIGNSGIINYLGEEIGFGPDDKVFQFYLNKVSLDEYRVQFPVLDDRDSFKLV
jgi:predicted amidohydrolase